ncbi:hypothetical protein KY386_02420 [Candidatus Parcubacteria bacterium]|nr:hypothetical protein [Candidatus Parcubacteria bacterium]
MLRYDVESDIAKVAQDRCGSPDISIQQRLVYSCPDGLYTAPAGEGDSDAVKLPGTEAADGLPVWSPDGRFIAWSRGGADPDSPQSIWLARADGSDARQLLPPGPNERLFWGAENRLYVSQRIEADAGEASILVLDTEGRVHPPPNTDVLGDAYTAVLSPDQRRIAYLMPGEELGSREVYVADADFSEPRRLDVQLEGFDVEWAGDSGGLYFYSSDKNGWLFLNHTDLASGRQTPVYQRRPNFALDANAPLEVVESP